jgi:N6-adenosine-specific RNA methylase IME4
MKLYNVIYADPPWSYDNKRTGSTLISGAEAKYSTMSNNEIMQLPIKDLCQKNAVCFMWVTVPLLPVGLQALDAWGFGYKTMLTWKKGNSLGMGFWFRGQCEHLVLGIRGKVKPFRIQAPNFYQCKPGKHSQKPHYFRALIEQAVKVSFESPEMLELFARSRGGLFPIDEYTGWDVYGNQIEGSISMPEVNIF